MRNNKILITILALAVLGAGAFWAGTVNAETDTSDQTIADKLAERFNLNANEVEASFDEFHQERREERQQQMQAYFEERLGEAVSDGVISEEQKQSFMEKKQEMMAQREQLREEWRTWAEESGIDFSQLREYGIGQFGKGFDGRHFGGSGRRGW